MPSGIITSNILLIIEVLLFIIFLVLSAFFSASETALISLNKIKLRHKVEEGDKHAILISQMLKKPENLLATILIGNNLVNISASVLTTIIIIQIFGEKALPIGIGVGILTLIILIFGEITPKAFAVKNSERISYLVAKPIHYLGIFLYPLVVILTRLAKMLTMGKESKKSPFITEKEIKTLLKVGEEEGTIDKEDMELIHKVFRFGDVMAKEVMTKREKIVASNFNENAENVLKIINETGHSRVPIYKENIDNIIGMVYVKDFLREERSNIKINEILRPIFFANENIKVRDLLREMQRRKMNMAILLNEKKKVSGLITTEDLMEEIVGEIEDEIDIEKS